MRNIEISFGLIEKTATGLGKFLFGTVSADEVFKSPIKAAIKWGAKHLESLSFDNNTIFIVLSVLLTFAMLYSIGKLSKKIKIYKFKMFKCSYWKPDF